MNADLRPHFGFDCIPRTRSLDLKHRARVASPIERDALPFLNVRDVSAMVDYHGLCHDVSSLWWCGMLLLCDKCLFMADAQSWLRPTLLYMF